MTVAHLLKITLPKPNVIHQSKLSSPLRRAIVSLSTKMHGRPRKAATAENAAASAAKAQKLRPLQSQLLHNHQNQIYSKEAVELSAKLLEINPESYTAWNYRKLALQLNVADSSSDPAAVASLFDEELRVVEAALRQNFKSYGAWHHRKWVISKGHSSIQKELGLLDKFQKADSRNFHAWNYRRFVAELKNRSDEEELEYTKKLIDVNFSNYSSWHNRSVLLSNLMKNKVEGFSKKEEVLTREYKLVREALFTDEDDQSGWFYHLWLLEQTVKPDAPMLASSWPANGSDLILLGESCITGSSSSPFNTFQSDSGTFPLILYFNRAVKGVNSSTIAISCGSNTIKEVIWNPLLTNNSQTAQVWVTELNILKAEHNAVQSYPVEVTVGYSQGVISTSGVHYGDPSRFTFTFHEQPGKIEHCERSGLGKFSWGDENFRVYKPHSAESNLVAPLGQVSIRNEYDPSDLTWQAKVIAEEIKYFRDLLDCKIGKLTLARLLTAHDALVSSGKAVHSEEVLRLYDELMRLDPTHSRYYKDEHSLAFLRQVTSGMESLLSYCFHYGNLTSSVNGNPICLRLNKLSLLRIGSFDKLLWVQMLDLSHNELQSIEGLGALQLLSSLSLSNNKLGSFTALGPLRHLKSLKVLDISYNEIGSHTVDTTRYLCPSPLSHSVNGDWDREKVATDGISVRDYWEAFFTLKDLSLIQIDVVGNAIADEKFTAFLAKVLPTLKWTDGVQLN